MVSLSDEVASFRDLVTSWAGAGFLFCAAAAAISVSVIVRGVIEVGATVSFIMLVGLVLAALLAYALPRDSLIWAVTRPAIAGLTLILGAGFAGALVGYSADGYIEESMFGLVGIAGAALVFMAMPAAVAVAAVMAVHGAGGRSEGPDGFPEE